MLARTVDKIIRIVTGALAVLVAALFTLGYNDIHYHNAVVHGGAEIPVPTAFVNGFAPWALLLPVLVVGFGIALRNRETPLAVLTSSAWLFSLAWPLLCIFAWECPLILL